MFIEKASVNAVTGEFLLIDISQTLTSPITIFESEAEIKLQYNLQKVFRPGKFYSILLVLMCKKDMHPSSIGSGSLMMLEETFCECLLTGSAGNQQLWSRGRRSRCKQLKRSRSKQITPTLPTPPLLLTHPSTSSSDFPVN